jgi:hypothetical protein
MIATRTSDRLSAVRVRHRLAPVDDFISLLEERNLNGERTLDRGLREQLCTLEAVVGAPLPGQAARARNTAGLHAALLDWQGTLLDSLLPERLRYYDLRDGD